MRVDLTNKGKAKAENNRILDVKAWHFPLLFLFMIGGDIIVVASAFFSRQKSKKEGNTEVRSNYSNRSIESESKCARALNIAENVAQVKFGVAPCRIAVRSLLPLSPL